MWENVITALELENTLKEKYSPIRPSDNQRQKKWPLFNVLEVEAKAITVFGVLKCVVPMHSGWLQ